MIHLKQEVSNSIEIADLQSEFYKFLWEEKTKEVEEQLKNTEELKALHEIALKEKNDKYSTLEAKISQLENQIIALNKSKAEDLMIQSHTQTEMMRHKVSSESKDQLIKELKTLLAEKPVQQVIQAAPLPEIVKPVIPEVTTSLTKDIPEPTPNWNIEPKRDGADKILRYIMTPDSGSIPGWNIEAKRDGADKVLKYVLTPIK